MRLAIYFAAALFALPAAAADTAPAQPAVPPAVPTCDSAEHHQLDFWLGTWNGTWQGGHAINRITRDFKNCVIVENFQDQSPTPPPNLRGMSVSSYDRLNKMWRQSWVDDQNGFYHLSGGPKPDGTFVLQNIRMGREPKMQRMVFENIKPDSFTWRWQSSEDGDKWTDTWVIQYTRMK